MTQGRPVPLLSRESDAELDAGLALVHSHTLVVAGSLEGSIPMSSPGSAR